MNESQFQKKLIHEIKSRFPGSIILKTDANLIQGFPDLLILYGSHWAALECKKSKDASLRPNQEYYIRLLNEMSFASFIFPEVKDEVLNAMEQSF